MVRHLTTGLCLWEVGVKRFIDVFILVLLVVLGLGGCTSTSLRDVWSENDTSGARFERILVVGFTENERNRRIFEDEFVAQLSRIDGVTATASIQIMPPTQGLERSQIDAILRNGEYDSVLMTQLLSIAKEQVVIPGKTTYFYDRYYPGGHATLYYDPPRIEEIDVVRLETSIYRVEGMKMVWSALSESFEPGSVNILVDDLARLVINSLRQKGFF